MNDAGKYSAMIVQALAPLGEEEAAEIRPVVWALFEMVYPDLLKAVAGNPVEHHLVVLGHMMEIVRQEMSPDILAEQAAALAILHDISPVEKITTQMVTDIRKEDPGKADALELKRQQNRILHMREGSAMAQRRMLELNEHLGKIIFDAQTIDIVCETIRIHDNPSLNIPIPRAKWLAVAFREADRLWMVTREGILTDLRRKNKDVNDPETYRKQLKSNIIRFREERSIYRTIELTEGPFCDDETFFRTKTGYLIFQRLCEKDDPRLSQKKP